MADAVGVLQTLGEASRDPVSPVRREHLFERLSRLQRSIPHGAGLQEVLDAIAAGAAELTGDDFVGLRLVGSDDPAHAVLAAALGVDDSTRAGLQTLPVDDGISGRSIREGRLVVVEDYQAAHDAIPLLRERGVHAAMAAPIGDDDAITGSLVVGSCREGRRYDDAEQEVLLALAQHAGLALKNARALEALREAQRSKDMFLAMVSHELKSPLTVIIGTLQTLRRHRSALPETARDQMVESAFERAQELSWLINSVLEGTRAELNGQIETIDVADLVDGGISGFDQARPIQIDPVPRGRIVVDATAVRRIVGIFVENAMSHSPDGSPVGVTCDFDRDRVRIAITNEGDLPADLEHSTLFDPFVRGAGAFSKGVGLGLYIASRLAAAIDGRIEVNAGEGRVSFSIQFPAQPAPPAETEASDR